MNDKGQSQPCQGSGYQIKPKYGKKTKSTLVVKPSFGGGKATDEPIVFTKEGMHYMSDFKKTRR